MKKWFKNLKDAILKCPEILLLFIIFFVFGCVFVVLVLPKPTETKADEVSEYYSYDVSLPFNCYFSYDVFDDTEGVDVTYTTYPDFYLYADKVVRGIVGDFEYRLKYVRVTGTDNVISSTYISLYPSVSSGQLSDVLCTVRAPYISPTPSFSKANFTYTLTGFTQNIYSSNSPLSSVSYSFVAGAGGGMRYTFTFESGDSFNFLISLNTDVAHLVTNLPSSGFTNFSSSADVAFNKGYNAGLADANPVVNQTIIDDAYSRGHSVGYQEGYDVGITKTQKDVNPVSMILDTATSVLNFAPFGSRAPYLTLGSLLLIPFGFLMFRLLLKLGSG